MFCNTADNQYFKHAAKRGLNLNGKTPGDLIKMRLPYVQETRKSYEEFWIAHVCKYRER